jgi:hypothetical protein
MVYRTKRTKRSKFPGFPQTARWAKKIRTKQAALRLSKAALMSPNDDSLVVEVNEKGSELANIV